MIIDRTDPTSPTFVILTWDDEGSDERLGVTVDCQHLTTVECCNGWDMRCLDCGREHV